MYIPTFFPVPLVPLIHLHSPVPLFPRFPVPLILSVHSNFPLSSSCSSVFLSGCTIYLLVFFFVCLLKIYIIYSSWTDHLSVQLHTLLNKSLNQKLTLALLWSTELTLYSKQAVRVVFDGSSRRIKSITNKLSDISVNVDQGFYWYNSSAGNNINSTQTSGAYVFRFVKKKNYLHHAFFTLLSLLSHRPNGTTPFDVNPQGIQEFSVTQVNVTKSMSR